MYLSYFRSTIPFVLFFCLIACQGGSNKSQPASENKSPNEVIESTGENQSPDEVTENTGTDQNQPPIANAITEVTNQNQPITITLTGTDGDGSIVSWAASSVPTNLNNAISINGNLLTFNPGDSFIGDFIFFVTATDDGGAQSEVVAITITVIELLTIPNERYASLSVNQDSEATVCVIDREASTINNELVCWGSNEYGLASPPELTNPQSVDVGLNVACALDLVNAKNVLHCWGDSANAIRVKRPSFLNPSSIFVGTNHACVKEDGNVICWGDDFFKNTLITQDIVDIKASNVQGFDTCFIDSGNLVVCSELTTILPNPPALVSPQGLEMDTTRQAILTIDEGNVVPISLGSSLKVLETLSSSSLFENPVIDLSVGTLAACAGDGSEVQCAGRAAQTGLNHRCVSDKSGIICNDVVRSASLNPPSFNSPYEIAVGTYFTCVAESRGIRCWGGNRAGESTTVNPVDVYSASATTCILDDIGFTCPVENSSGGGVAAHPKLGAIQDLSMDVELACAIDRLEEGSNRLVCWGSEAAFSVINNDNMPAVTNPTHVAVWSSALGGAKSQACVVDEDKVMCWGSEFNETSNMANISHIITNDKFTCTADNTGITCWGTGPVVTEIPTLTGAVSELEGNDYHACALMSGGLLNCWGLTIFKPEVPASLVNAKFVDVDLESVFTCGIHSTNQVACWGKNNTDFDQILNDAPELTAPTRLSIGNDYACVIDNSKLVCWGNVPNDLKIPLKHF